MVIFSHFWRRGVKLELWSYTRFRKQVIDLRGVIKSCIFICTNFEPLKTRALSDNPLQSTDPIWKLKARNDKIILMSFLSYILNMSYMTS